MKEKNLFLVELEDYAWHLCESVKLARLLHRLNELSADLPNCGETAGIKEFAEYADSRTRELYRKRGPAYGAMLSGNIDDMVEVADAELAVPQLDIYVCCNCCDGEDETAAPPASDNVVDIFEEAIRQSWGITPEKTKDAMDALAALLQKHRTD